MKDETPQAEDMVPRALLEDAMEGLYLIGIMESQIPAHHHLNIVKQTARDTFDEINKKLGNRPIRVKL